MTNLRIRKTTVALAALTMTATSAIGIATATAASASSSRPTYTLSASGRHVTVKKNHEIRLDLRTNRDGGYTWSIAKGASGTHLVHVVSRTIHPYKHTKHAAGYPYHTIYILKAAHYGTGVLKLVERRPSHKSDLAKIFRLHLHVPKPAPKHACTKTSSGTCIQGGKFCPQASYGKSGWDASGTRWVCKGDKTHPHWERP